LGKFFDELRRRNVFRVAIAYLISGWLVLQVAELVLGNIGAPAWVMKALLLFGALGFPFVLVFSWAYELTPEGIKKESEVDRDHSITRDTGRKLNIATIGMLIAVIGVVIIERAFFHEGHEGEAAAIATAVPEKSIAVLAFDDLSPEGDHAYCAEGLSEELLNVLAQVGDLQVAGRTSSFAFKGQNKDLREIGELLNVANILEGSVRRAGNRIRVTAQLINASSGYHLFSETYDRELSDVFAVQDEIAREISNALLSEIVGTEATTTARTNPEAYELYLLARQRIHTRDTVQMRQAESMLTRALEIDPLYAPALAQKALVTHLMSDRIGSYGDMPSAVAMPVAMQLVDQALAIDNQLAEALAIKGLLTNTLGEPEEAIVYLEQALQMNPTMSDAANWLALTLYSLGRANETSAVFEGIVKRDPTFGPAFTNLVWDHMRTGKHDEANALIQRVARIVGENSDVAKSRSAIAMMTGQPAAAIELLRHAMADSGGSSFMRVVYGFVLRSVADYETLLDEGVAETRLVAYANLGEMEKALEILGREDLDASLLLGYAPAELNRHGRSQALLDFVRQRYGSLDTLLDKEDLASDWGAGYLPELAFAYRATGDEESFLRLLQLIPETLDAGRARGNNNWVMDYDEAAYLALSGNSEAALTALDRAVDKGLFGVQAAGSAIFAGLHGNPRFEALRQRLADHVDAERAKLGMPPYRPISTTDEERPVYVH